MRAGLARLAPKRRKASSASRHIRTGELKSGETVVGGSPLTGLTQLAELGGLRAFRRLSASGRPACRIWCRDPPAHQLSSAQSAGQFVRVRR